MTSRVAGGPDRGERWPAAVASLAVGGAFFALWFWLLPSWLGFHVDTAGAARWRWVAAVPSVLGFAVALRCIWDFGWTGRGTGTAGSTEAAGRGGFLPIRAESHVCGVLHRVGGFVGDLRKSAPAGNRSGVRGCAGHSSVCATVRGAHAAQEVRRGLREVLQKRPAMGATAAGMAAVSRLQVASGARAQGG